MRYSGMMWSFDPPKSTVARATLEAGILEAGTAYLRKHGKLPTLCVLNPKWLEAAIDEKIGTMTVEYRREMQPNCLLVGQEAE